MKTKLTSLLYLGHTSMDPRFTKSMVPWLLREIRQTGYQEQVSVVVEDGYLKAFNKNFEPIVVHRTIDIMRISQVPGNPEDMFYILYNEKEDLLNCHLYRAGSAQEVTDLFGQMREASPGVNSPRGSVGSLAGSAGAVTRNLGFQSGTSSEHLPWNSGPAMSLPKNCHLNLQSECQPQLVRSSSNASTLTSLCADLSPSDSHFFEVLYVGKVRISQRKVPESLIDDALTKFAQHEADKAKVNQMRRNSLLSSTGTSIYSSESGDQKESSVDIAERKVTLTNTSTTPLEPDKTLAWSSEVNLKVKADSPPKNNDFDEEFEQFTKERVEKNGQFFKKATVVPLEPKVLILNIPTMNNLGTVNEDEAEDSHTHIKDDYKIVDKNKNVVNELYINESDLIPDEKDEVQPKKSDIIDPTTQESTGPMKFNEFTRKPKGFLRSKTGLDNNMLNKTQMPENKPFLRDRSASIGTINLKTPIAQLIGEQNRTMLFQVGRTELRLISPDRKQILLHRSFKDVASCVLGRSNKEHFGFVCRESTDAFACYVFKCESDSVAQEVINAIKQAFFAHAELIRKTREKSPNMSCEHCPMLWYHRLCHDVEGMNDKKTHAFILRRLEQLPDDEQEQVIVKYQGGTNHIYETNEHNAFLMMLLRAHCEAKQLRHVHDTAENRSEFLNQYLGGSTIFMKAKRSLSSGFDHLLKRRPSQPDVMPGVNVRKEPSPSPLPDTAAEPAGPPLLLPPDARCKSMSPGLVVIDAPPTPPSPSAPLPRTPEEDEEPRGEGAGQGQGAGGSDPAANSAMMDIFLKVSDQRAAGAGRDPRVEEHATWRQAIYRRVLQPELGEDTQRALLSIPAAASGRRGRQQLRGLWRRAIEQTVLLVRMERENARLREKAETSAMRRIKLEYLELASCDAGAALMWDSLLASRGAGSQARLDRHMLRQAVIQGVPRTYRGSVWYFLAEQAALRSPPPDTARFPHYNTPYRTLLAGLTKHQHAILIDLGRTFPQHSYFAAALGPGQLALYNVLKAYSLLDPEVGYCQGLSFVAGVLLLHLEEAEAFVLLRHLMFRRGLRNQYLPDMSALQVQLYQMSRLLRDHECELHAHLELQEAAPALYAAPWMLTLFTSLFPLGFVVRVFDLLFLESMDVVFSVSLSLLSVHKDGLLMCESCEEAAEYLKHKLPNVDANVYKKVMKKVHSLDLRQQLSSYAVEYAVLQEEMPRLTELAAANRRLSADKGRMGDELDSAMEAITNYQTNQARLDAQVKNLDQQLNLLSRYISAYHRQDLPMEIKRIVQSHSKKYSFSTKIFASKRTNNEDDEEKKTFKTGLSTPNLFAKITRDEVLNAANREIKTSPDIDKRRFMKKSLSVQTGLMSNKYPLKVLEEKNENDPKYSDANDIINDLKELKRRSTGISTQEQIRQERLFEKQLKHDFDENLRKLDEKPTTPKSYIDDLDIFQSRRSMSLQLSKGDRSDDRSDSGFVTPLSPVKDSVSVVSHPLSDCDVDIKFDGQSTQLKQLRPAYKNY